jgi:endonuclease YncB( thermonuclease family)
VAGRHRFRRSFRPRPTRVRHQRTGAASPWLGTAVMILLAFGFIATFGYAFSSAPAPGQRASSQPADVEMAEHGNAASALAPLRGADSFVCDSPRVTDGDTIRCGVLRVRLASIDAPELPGHCRRGRTCASGDPFASKANLERMMTGAPTVCRQTDTDHYGRVVALCSAGGRDLSCAQVEGGYAIVRYGELTCSNV